MQIDPPTILLAAVCAALALLAIALGVALSRRNRELARRARELRELERAQEGAIKAEVERRVRAEQKKLAKEHERRSQQLSRREAEVKGQREALAEERVKLEERAAALDVRAEELAEQTGTLDARMASVESREKQLEEADRQAREKLEQIAGLTAEQARQQLLGEVEREISGEVARMIQKADRQARAQADEVARQSALTALAGLKGAVAAEGTVTVVQLPNDEMKGRVIGREGRNIRSLEHATGVDLLVDDTPGAIILSSWDPLRRTVAARALRLLVEDGRIHPARIEEVVEKTRLEADQEAKERGETAVYELGISGLHERLVLLLGRLSFFTVHGQNLLQRSEEVAQLCGILAHELLAGGEELRRAGLLHEIARADKDTIANHPAVASADIAARFGEPAAVTNPIRALAQPADAPRTPEGVLLVTARRLVLSRPGARRDNLQRHVDRQQQVEEIARQREGIDRAVAVRAGRELRVHVSGEVVDDERALLLARDLAREIEGKVDYPGQIRVLVIRETRAVSYAV
jgi:ribonuclease Y